MRWPPVLSCIVAAVSYSVSVYDLPQMWHSLACLNFCLSSSHIFNGLLKCPLFFCSNQLLLFLPWIYRQHFLLCIFKLACCICHHDNKLLYNYIHSLCVSGMLQCMIHYCLLPGADVWISVFCYCFKICIVFDSTLNSNVLLSLSGVYHITVSFVSVKYFFTAATLQTVHAKMHSTLMFCFVIYAHVKSLMRT